jgi:hypothetical protein
MRKWFHGAGLLLVLCGAAGGQVPGTSAWRDLTGRIEYGYYASDPGILAGALHELENSPDSVHADYLGALASYRLAQISVANDPARAEHALDYCLEAASRASQRQDEFTEALILVAACAEWARRTQPLKALLHDRRAQQARARAAELDPDNPRLALIDAQRLLRESPLEPLARRRLESALEAFAAEAGASQSWGEAEAYATLAAARLNEGDMRAARDLAERALLLAPDYALAREVTERVSSNR